MINTLVSNQLKIQSMNKSYYLDVIRKFYNDNHKLFDESKKKDDLSDSYLQGIFWLTK